MRRARQISGTRVIHRHRVGALLFCRVSELISVNGRPSIVLRVVNNAGPVFPLFTIELDPAKLRHAAGAPHIAFYDGETRDPRYEDVAPPSLSSTISAQAR